MFTVALSKQTMAAKPAPRRGSVVDVRHPHMNTKVIENLDLNPERQRNGFVKPKQVYCYLCAKEFGTTSLKIHCIVAPSTVADEYIPPNLLAHSRRFALSMCVRLVVRIRRERRHGFHLVTRLVDAEPRLLLLHVH